MSERMNLEETQTAITNLAQIVAVLVGNAPKEVIDALHPAQVGILEKLSNYKSWEKTI